MTKNIELRKLTSTEREEYNQKTDVIVDGILALPPESRVFSNTDFFRLQAELDQIHKDMSLVYTGQGLKKLLN